MKKRVLLLLVAALLCCAGGVGGTVAWLLSETAVVNTFVAGDISISLTETTGNLYNLTPGTVVSKDPKLTVYVGSEPCWLFVKIEETGELSKYVTYEIADGWTKLEDGVYYREYVKSNSNVEYKILENDAVMVKDTVTESDEIYLKKQGIMPEMKLMAYAIQWKSFNNPYDAWQEAKKH